MLLHDMKADMHQQSINQNKIEKFSFEKRNKDRSCKNCKFDVSTNVIQGETKL